MSMTTEEFLEHHGIKGQKWGIRRFQNKDGSLTNAGRKRYGDDSGGEKSSSAQKRSFFGRKSSGSSSSSKSSKDQTEEKKKDISSMTDEELSKAINRIRLEQTYSQLLIQTAPKPQVSRGKKFANTLFNEVIKPSAISTGKSVLNDLLVKYARELTGLNAKDAGAAQKKYLNELQDEVKRMTLEAQKAKLDAERKKK